MFWLVGFLVFVVFIWGIGGHNITTDCMNATFLDIISEIMLQYENKGITETFCRTEYL